MSAQPGPVDHPELRAALPDATVAPLSLCSDNAAMIASAARYTEHLSPAEALSALDDCSEPIAGYAADIYHFLSRESKIYRRVLPSIWRCCKINNV